MKRAQGKPLRAWVIVLAFVSFLIGGVSAQNSDVLGEVQFEGKTKVEKTSGVWVDGQYVGYLNELKASKKVLLLPGQHTISVRQNGYQDFTRTVVLQPGQTQVIRGSSGGGHTVWPSSTLLIGLPRQTNSVPTRPSSQSHGSSRSRRSA